MVSTDRCVCRTEDGRILEGWKLVVLKFYYDQNLMSRMKQKCVLYGLSDVAVPVVVT